MNQDSVRDVWVVSMDISFEPLENKYPCEVEEFGNTFFHKEGSALQKLLPQMEKLLVKYPDCEVLTNWHLTMLRKLSVQDDIINELTEKYYKKFPNYLFAKATYAELCFSKNEWEKVPDIFNNSFVLNYLYPDRDVFHVTEVIVFYHITGKYHCYAQKIESAQACIELLESLDTERNCSLLRDLKTTFLLQCQCPEAAIGLFLDEMMRHAKGIFGKKRSSPARKKKTKKLKELT